MKHYRVKEIYYTLQGEGRNTGRAAVFCRFSGCNLWSGREDDRATAICNFCDTDFAGIDGSGGGNYTSAEALATAIINHWPGTHAVRPFVVCTGGEPLLQMDAPLIEALHVAGFEIAVETNGTRLPPPGIDWICVSPKANTDLVLKSGDELKLVYPQAGIEPEMFEGFDFQHFLLSPMAGPDYERNVRRSVEYCLAHPRWQLTLQTHKWIGIR